MRYALPPGESAIVERLVFACLAGGLGAIALIFAVEGLRFLGAPDDAALPRSFHLSVLGVLFVAFTVSFALVTAGTMPRARRVRLGVALGLVAIAAAAAPMTFFGQLPDAWQRPEIYHSLAMIPGIALALALALAAPPRTRRWAWAGAGLLLIYAALHRLDAELVTSGWLRTPIEYRAWRVVPATVLVAGIVTVAIAYARGATWRAPRGRG